MASSHHGDSLTGPGPRSASEALAREIANPSGSIGPLGMVFSDPSELAERIGRLRPHLLASLHAPYGDYMYSSFLPLSSVPRKVAHVVSASSQESLPQDSQQDTAMDQDDQDSIRAEESTTEDLLQSLQEPPPPSNVPVPEPTENTQDKAVNKKFKLKRSSFSEDSPAVAPPAKAIIPLPSADLSPIPNSPLASSSTVVVPPTVSVVPVPVVDVPTKAFTPTAETSVSGGGRQRVSLKDLASRKRKLESFEDPPSSISVTQDSVLQQNKTATEEWISMGKEYKSIANNFSSRVKREELLTDGEKKVQALALLASTLCYFSTLPLKDSLDSFQAFYFSCSSMTEASLSHLGKAGLVVPRTLLCLLDTVLAAWAGEALASKARHLKSKMEKLGKEESAGNSVEELERVKGQLEKTQAIGLSLWETVGKRSREAHEQCPNFHGKFT